MVRAAADLEILDVRPDIGHPQRATGVEVDVVNRNTSAAPNETTDQGWVIVEADAITQPALWHCFVIEPQAQDTAEGCSISTGCQGDFSMPDAPVNLTVTAGGYAEDSGTCSEVRFVGTETDTATHTIQPAQTQASFDVFRTGGQGGTETGPFPPGSNPRIAEFLVSNIGEDEGNINIEFAEVDQSGNVVNTICSTIVTNVFPGQTAGIIHDPVEGITCEGILTPSNPTPLSPTLSNERGVTQYFGLRTWSNDESRPPFPSATMATRTRG